MSALSLIGFGLIIGLIAKLLMPGRDSGGLIITILIGITGSFIGGFIGLMIWPGLNLSRPVKDASWIMSILGAIILLALYRLLFVSRRAH